MTNYGFDYDYGFSLNVCNTHWSKNKTITLAKQHYVICLETFFSGVFFQNVLCTVRLVPLLRHYFTPLKKERVGGWGVHFHYTFHSSLLFRKITRKNIGQLIHVLFDNGSSKNVLFKSRLLKILLYRSKFKINNLNTPNYSRT